MYPVLILLVLLNATLFAWGFFWSPDAQPGLPSLVEPSIPALELRQDVGEVVYRSSAAVRSGLAARGFSRPVLMVVAPE